MLVLNLKSSRIKLNIKLDVIIGEFRLALKKKKN